MPLRFPLQDVSVRRVDHTRTVEHPVYGDEYWQMNQVEFAMQVEGVGSFYACNGNEVEYAPLPDAVPELVGLYLNGSVYGAILHQRQILPLHGSSFIEKGKGILICGDSGAGKSSLAAAFCIKGGQFLTDDVTPVVLSDGRPFIVALSDYIKLWDNTLEQLELDRQGLRKIDRDTEKYYYPMDQGTTELFPLDMLFILEIHDQPDITCAEITGAEKAMTVRNELYRSEYLKGMKDNEAIYFNRITGISKVIRIIRVRRPSRIQISRLKSVIVKFIEGQ